MSLIMPTCCCCCCCSFVLAGKVFISMADKYKADAVGIAKQLTDMGYQVVATRGTASTLMSAGEASCQWCCKATQGKALVVP